MSRPRSSRRIEISPGWVEKCGLCTAFFARGAASGSAAAGTRQFLNSPSLQNSRGGQPPAHFMWAPAPTRPSQFVFFGNASSASRAAALNCSSTDIGRAAFDSGSGLVVRCSPRLVGLTERLAWDSWTFMSRLRIRIGHSVLRIGNYGTRNIAPRIVRSNCKC
jgi:hypothetical protein